MSAPTLDRTKVLPRDPTPAMQEAMEQHFRKWQKILGYSDTQMKALCWDAMQAYYCMWDVAPTIDRSHDA